MGSWFFRILVLATAVLLAVAAFRYAADRGERDDGDAGDRLSLQAEQDRGALPLGPHDVEFPITNTGTTPRRLVGASGPSCGSTCCWVPMDVSAVVVIGPGETFVFRCQLQITGAGPFEAPMTLFLDDGHLRTVTVRVRGVGRPKAENTRDTEQQP